MSDNTALVRRLAALERRMAKESIVDRARPVVARAATAAGQSIPNATATIINFDSVTFDPDGQIATGAAWKFTATIAGYYRVAATVAFASTTAWALGEVGDIRLYKNGLVVTVLDRSDSIDSSLTAQIKYLTGGDLIFLAAGDYIDIRAVQTTGGALALQASAANCFISINRVN